MTIKIQGYDFWQRIGLLFLLLFLLLLPWQFLAAAPVTLNLNAVEISALINTVSEITGKNFIIDPRVKGKVSVVSQQPLEPDALYNVFLSVLDIHGFVAIPVAANVVKIIPDANAKQSNTPVLADGITTGRADEIATRVIRLKNVSASQLVPILRPLIPQQSHLAAYPGTNLLLIADRIGNIERLLKIIERIDTNSSEAVEIIPLSHATANEVVRVLKELFERNQNKDSSEPLKLVADERTNSVLLSGETSLRLRLRTLITHLDTPLDSGGNTQVIYLNYASAKDLVPVLKGVSDTVASAEGAANAKTATNNNINIQADEQSNALVITAPPAILRSLQEVIAKLDIRRAQIMIKAIIADISADKAAELGVQWVVDGRENGSAVGVINFTGAGRGLANLLNDPPTIVDGMSLGLGRFDNNSVDFGALLQALSGDSQSNILSTPSLMTLDNQEASILVGQEVPFITGQYTGTGSGSGSTVNPFQTIQRQDIGVKLKIKPQINRGSSIKLNIEQEVSSIRQSAGRAADIITDKRTLNTQVLVNNGQLVVLGGLMDELAQESTQKVPLLGDIPVVGTLFRAKSSKRTKRNLMVFIYPLILDAEQLSAYSQQKYQSLRNEQTQRPKPTLELMPDTYPPVLPSTESLSPAQETAAPIPLTP